MSASSMEEELFPAIAEIVQKDYPGSLVTHFTSVITVVTDDGTEIILTLDRPGQALWQSMGLLKFVEEMRRALIADQVSDHDHEHDDDE